MARAIEFAAATALAIVLFGATASAQAVVAMPPEACAGAPGSEGCQVQVEDCHWGSHVRLGSCFCYGYGEPEDRTPYIERTCPVADHFLDPRAATLEADTASFLGEDDLLCVGWGDGAEIYCNFRIHECANGGGYCVWVCGTGMEEYKPCRLLPSTTLATASDMEVPGFQDYLAWGSLPEEQVACVGWGDGGIRCFVEAYTCTGSVGICVRTCPYDPRVHGPPCPVILRA